MEKEKKGKQVVYYTVFRSLIRRRDEYNQQAV